jgi:hypothetical protein
MVSAQILDEGFITDLTAEVNIRLAEAARRPQDTAKKLEQEIASRQRQVGRLTERLEKVQDSGGLDTIFDKVAELNQQLEAKRAELKDEQQRNRRPPVTSVKEKDVVVALPQLREVLLSADLAALTEKVRRRVVRWFRMQRLLDADAAADMLARENSGFSVDASVRITLIGRDVPSYFQSLEHLLRYCARPPFALERLSVIRGEDGRIACVRYVLPRHKVANWVGPGRGRKSTRPGASGVVELSPFEFLDRLADLVPPPRKHRHRPAGGWRGDRAKPRLWLRPP